MRKFCVVHVFAILLWKPSLVEARFAWCHAHWFYICLFLAGRSCVVGQHNGRGVRGAHWSSCTVLRHWTDTTHWRWRRGKYLKSNLLNKVVHVHSVLHCCMTAIITTCTAVCNFICRILAHISILECTHHNNHYAQFNDGHCIQGHVWGTERIFNSNKTYFFFGIQCRHQLLC